MHTTSEYALVMTSKWNACGISLALYLFLSKEVSKKPSLSTDITVDTNGQIIPAA